MGRAPDFRGRRSDDSRSPSGGGAPPRRGSASSSANHYREGDHYVNDEAGAGDGKGGGYFHIPRGYKGFVVPLTDPGVAPPSSAASASHSHGPRPPLPFRWGPEAPDGDDDQQSWEGEAPDDPRLAVDRHIPPADMEFGRRTSRRYHRVAGRKAGERLWKAGMGPCPYPKRSRSPRGRSIMCTGVHCGGLHQWSHFCGRTPPLCAKCCRFTEMDEGEMGHCQPGMTWRRGQVHWSGNATGDYGRERERY